MYVYIVRRLLSASSGGEMDVDSDMGMSKLMLLANVRQCIEPIEGLAAEFKTRLQALAALAAALELQPQPAALDLPAFDAALAAYIQLRLPELPAPPPPVPATTENGTSGNGAAVSGSGSGSGTATGLSASPLVVATVRTAGGDKLDGCSACNSDADLSPKESASASLPSICPLSSSSDVLLASANTSDASIGDAGGELSLADTLRSLDRAHQQLLDDEARLNVATDAETAPVSVSAPSSASSASCPVHVVSADGPDEEEAEVGDAGIEAEASDSLLFNPNASAGTTSSPEAGAEQAVQVLIADSVQELPPADAGATVAAAGEELRDDGVDDEEPAGHEPEPEPTDAGDGCTIDEPQSDELEEQVPESPTAAATESYKETESRSSRAASVADTETEVKRVANAGSGQNAVGLSSLVEPLPTSTSTSASAETAIQFSDSTDSFLRELTALLQTPAGGLASNNNNRNLKGPATAPPAQGTYDCIMYKTVAYP